MPPNRKTILLTAALILVAVFGWPPVVGAGKIHALVIGIDAYQSQGGELMDLMGAVNDAQDIAAALRELGAATVRVLLNEEAHRTAVLENWEALQKGARPGDLLIMTFAGHGAQEPERTPGSERDGMDEVMVLGGFRTTAPHNFQRIMDDEWRHLIAAASDYTVMTVFDACHSGTMTRSLATGWNVGRARFGNYGPITSDQLPPPPAEDRVVSQPELWPHEIYIGATRDDLVVHEIQIEGRDRGVLSYQFARALRGAADLNRDGVITRGELARFIDENVRQQSERRQYPRVQYAGADTVALLTVGACPAQSHTFIQNHLPLALDDLSSDEQARLRARLMHVVPADRHTAVLTWNAVSRTVVSQHGDVAARLMAGREDHTVAQLQGVIDKWRFLPALLALNECREPLRLRIVNEEGKEDDGLHQEGDRLTLEIPPRRNPYLILVNLPSTGKVEFLYPLSQYNDNPRIPPGEPYRQSFRIQAPFGGDHLIVLAARHKPAALYTALAQLEGQIAAEALYRLLHQALGDGGNDFEMGVLGFYTAPQRDETE